MERYHGEETCVKKNLYGELADTLYAIEGDKFPKDLFDLIVDNHKITFTKRFLNHDIYDSLVFSGEIKFLDYEIHQTIQDIFNMIKYHNHYLRLVVESQTHNDKIQESAIPYYIMRDRYEQQLIEKIPIMMSKLEKKFEPESAS